MLLVLAKESISEFRFRGFSPSNISCFVPSKWGEIVTFLLRSLRRIFMVSYCYKVGQFTFDNRLNAAGVHCMTKEELQCWCFSCRFICHKNRNTWGPVRVILNHVMWIKFLLGQSTLMGLLNNGFEYYLTMSLNYKSNPILKIIFLKRVFSPEETHTILKKFSSDYEGLAEAAYQKRTKTRCA